MWILLFVDGLCVLLSEYTIHKCSLDCINRPHYHCLYCITPLLSKQELNRHVLFCQEKPKTTASQEELGGITDFNIVS